MIACVTSPELPPSPPSVIRARTGEKLASVIAHEIVEQLAIDGAGPGQMLPPEAELIRHYGVSRGSLREALRLLEHSGVLAIRSGPGGGPIVQTVDSRDFARTSSLQFRAANATVRDLLEARLVIEPAMARRLTERADHESLDQIRLSILHAHSTVGEAHRNAVHSFHETVLHASQNRVMTLVGGSLMEILVKMASEPDYESQLEHTSSIHDEIYEKMMRGRSTAVERLMREHIQEVTDYYETDRPEFLDQPIIWRTRPAIATGTLATRTDSARVAR